MIKLPRRPGCLTFNPVYEWYFFDRREVVEYVKRLEEKLLSKDSEKDGVPCEICDGTGVLGECIGICEPPNQATHLAGSVPQCDDCDPKWRDR